RWRFQTGGVVRATPFADGLIYIPSEDGNHYAVDSATGAERWRVAFGQGTVVLSPVVTGGMVLVSTRGVSALDAETGARLWDVPQTAYDLQTTTGPTTSTASIAGDSVFLYLPDRGGVTSLDLATGEERGFAATQPVRGSPAIAGGVLYVASTDGIAFALAGQGAAPTPAVQSASPTALPVLASTMTPATGGLPATYLWSVDAGAALLAFPPDRTIWAVDVVAGTVTILDRDGVPIGTWGTPGEGPGQFNFKEDEADGWWVDVAFAADGSFWITECGNERVEHFDASRNLIGSFGIKGSGDGQFLCPAGVVIGENGDLFVADEIRGNIQRFTSDGAFVASFGSFAGPGPLDLDAQGNLIVPDSNGRRVAVLAQDGTEVLEVGQLGGDQGQLSFPVEAIVDDAGNFYVADQYAASLLVFDPHGAFIGSVDMGQAPDGPVTGVYAVGDGGNDSVYVSVGLRDGSVRVQKYKITVPTGPASTSGTPAA
ncbi:MAG TPA: PQQ-binding-like beta-propeller repeat protein, partial [Thermomicrobiales bacterium]|nr:PQQ-binding-like beta-propeller repeat protein [Thermomicrobiales bacterium]